MADIDDKAEQLWSKVASNDVDASLALLQDAGGACQARDLAKLASGVNGYSQGVHVGYGVTVDNVHDTETISLYKRLSLSSTSFGEQQSSWRSRETIEFVQAGAMDEFVVGLTQKSCQRASGSGKSKEQ